MNVTKKKLSFASIWNVIDAPEAFSLNTFSQVLFAYNTGGGIDSIIFNVVELFIIILIDI